MLLPINLPQTIPTLRIYPLTGRRPTSPSTALEMLQERQKLNRILEAPLTHHQSLHLPANQLLGVEGRVPWFYEKRPEDNFEDVGVRRGFGIRLARFR